MAVFILYLFIANLIGFVLMFKDKQYAKKHMWRVKESTLFLTAILLGSLGIFLGMRIFRHKTKHWKFVVFIPLIIISQVALIYWFLTKYIL